MFNHLDERNKTGSKLRIGGVSARYLCECGKVQPRKEMRREYDFGYDQLCCTKCGDVLIDDLHGVVHCNVC